MADSNDDDVQEQGQQLPLATLVEDMALAEESLGELAQLLGHPDTMDATKIYEILQLCNDQLQSIVGQMFGERSDEVRELLKLLMDAQLRGEEYCKVSSGGDGEGLKDVVELLREMGVLETADEDEEMVRIAL